MVDELFAQAWDALYGGPPPDDVAEAPLRGLPELLVPGPVLLETGHRFGDLSGLPEDPWIEMLVRPEADLALAAWAFRAARLLPMGRGPDNEWLVVDLEADPGGDHRTYVLDPQGRNPVLLFGDLDELLRWLSAPCDVEPVASDAWSEHLASVECSLGLLWRLHPTLLFGAFRDGAWPDDGIEEPVVDLGSPGWRRLALIWTLAHFRRSREPAVPLDLDPSTLTPTHQILLERLRDLGEAIRADEVPVFVADLSLDDDEEVSQAAMDWMLLFDQARAEPERTPTELMERTQGLLALLQRAVEELIRQELIEVEPQRRTRLVEDLLEVTLKAPRPDAVIPRVLEELMESRNVEEVFADDTELRRVLAAALGFSKKRK